MTEPIRPSTVLPALRTPFTLTTSDGQTLIGEVAAPLTNPTTALLCLHPNPTGGGMMDSHVYKKAANRLPDMAGVTVIRFNTRGTTSEAGTSTGEYDGGVAEKYDVQAAIDYCFDVLKVSELWIVGWSFGTELALKYGIDHPILGAILLSPPLHRATDADLARWATSEKTLVALVPELDDYLQPEEAKRRFAIIPHAEIIGIDGAKHLWVGESATSRVLNEIVKVVNPSEYPLPTHWSA
mgnify:CR=1 FL=1